MRLVGWSCRRGRGRGSCGRVWLFSEGGSGSGPLFLVGDRSWIFWLDFFLSMIPTMRLRRCFGEEVMRGFMFSGNGVANQLFIR
jgi:hypothetical protein